jgi:hypothetical protein
MTKIKNLHELGTDLLEVYSQLRDGNIEKSTAKALSSVAGKVIDTLKVQMRYNSIKANIDKVQLLERPKNVKKLLH